MFQKDRAQVANVHMVILALVLHTTPKCLTALIHNAVKHKKKKKRKKKKFVMYQFFAAWFRASEFGPYETGHVFCRSQCMSLYCQQPLGATGMTKKHFADPSLHIMWHTVNNVSDDKLYTRSPVPGTASRSRQHHGRWAHHSLH